MEARGVGFAMARLEMLEREVPKVRGLGAANSPGPRFWIMDAWGERSIGGRGMKFHQRLSRAPIYGLDASRESLDLSGSIHSREEKGEGEGGIRFSRRTFREMAKR